ncbi:selenoprotein Pb-like isoform X2 [Pseudophryne corroboree]
MMGGSALFMTTLLGLLALVSSSLNETSICKPAPHWSIGSEVPMGKSYGQVTVVALLQASCGFCLIQAANMGPLRDKLTSQGLTNISYMIVNDQSSFSKLLFEELKRRAPEGVPVYQQLPKQDDVWDILDGNKDDFLIYDRCGRLTFHIRLPHSILHFPYVYAAIHQTYYEDSCQNCSFYANITNNATKNATVDNSTDGKTEQESSHKKTQNSGESHDHSNHSGGREERDHKSHPATNRKGENQQKHHPINNNGPQNVINHNGS